MKDDAFLKEAVSRRLLEPLDARFLGPRGFIYCYVGSPPGHRVFAREFLDSLPDEPAASYGKSFEKHCHGLQLRGEKHRVWTEKGCEGLYEYKDIQSKSRILHVMEAGFVEVLLFGFEGKKENQVDQDKVNLAKRLRDEYRTRRNALGAELARRKR